MNDTDLKERLSALLSETVPGNAIDTNQGWREFQLLQSRSGRNRRKALRAAIAVVAAVAIIVPIWAGHRPGGRAAREHRSAFDASAHTRAYPDAIVARIPVGGVISLVADGSAVWAVRAYDQAGVGFYQLVKIDTRSNKVTLRVSLGSHPQEVAAAAGMVWLTTGHSRTLGQLVRLDPVTGRVIATAHLAAGRCDLIAFSPPNLWAECAVGSIWSYFLRINPATGRETGRAGPLHSYTASIAATPGGVWYADLYTNIYGLVGVGRASARSIKVRVPALPFIFSGQQALTYAQGFVWALSAGESVAKIDTATGRVLRIYTYRTYDPGKVGGLDFLTAGNGSLWFLDDGYPFSGVLRVSIATGRPLGAVPEPKAGDCGPTPCSQIYSTPGAIWVPTAVSLLRIDPARLPA